jgi:site-specific DNA recombinase
MTKVALYLQRPGLQALLEDARHGKFDVVLTERLDRFSRDLAASAALFKQLRFAGVRVVTLSEGERAKSEN